MQRNPFPTRDVVVISFPGTPHRLCARGQRVATIVESWDHPAKKPAGYYSDVAVSWNEDLAREWSRFQGAEQSLVGYPVKLEYALAGAARSERSREHRPRAMYAAGTSSNTDRPRWFADELVIIEQLCHATQRAGWRLMIKPKPNGRIGDFDRFTTSFEHVSAGAYGHVTDAADYDLDDDYNTTRLAELSSCDLVINSVTTFALDAAVAGLPVLQVDVRDDPTVPALAVAMRNHHIATHLLHSPFVLSTDQKRSVCDAAVQVLSGSTECAERFSQSLREWVLPPQSPEEAIRHVLDSLEQAS